MPTKALHEIRPRSGRTAPPLAAACIDAIKIRHRPLTLRQMRPKAPNVTASPSYLTRGIPTSPLPIRTILHRIAHMVSSGASGEAAFTKSPYGQFGL